MEAPILHLILLSIAIFLSVVLLIITTANLPGPWPWFLVMQLLGVLTGFGGLTVNLLFQLEFNLVSEKLQKMGIVGISAISTGFMGLATAGYIVLLAMVAAGSTGSNVAVASIAICGVLLVLASLAGTMSAGGLIVSIKILREEADPDPAEDATA